MRTDSIFYKLFQQFPGLLFEFVDEPPPEAQNYQFESVEVKETAFRIDGVFLPPDYAPSKVVYFAEVQFQKDEDLYHRFFTESLFFMYRNKERYHDWYGVVIFASRSLEPTNTTIHRSLLAGDQVRRVYLDELGDIKQQPLSLGLMLLTAIPDTQPDQAVEAARYLLVQAQQQPPEDISPQAIIDLVTTIMVYKFKTLSREEIGAMLGSTLEETRFYRDAVAEGRVEGRVEGIRSLVLELINYRFGDISEQNVSKIEQLSLEKLRSLSLALFNFSSLADLESWLQSQPSE
ncbi:MAG TPA: Rpn family recombination-promoting nuclease/putative transposase [Nostocaceae cyanobacterium]|nr:Rpn family recombination-promoting nuclease/putative transposase [Nostocaceae cyanobacterium]